MVALAGPHAALVLTMKNSAGVWAPFLGAIMTSWARSRASQFREQAADVSTPFEIGSDPYFEIGA
jgi:hypothetical protein